MPLRYLQLPEAQYVPQYAQLDRNMLNTVDTQIQSQIEQGKQQLDKYDAMVDTTMQSLATLPESQRLAFQEMANKTKAELDASVDTQGYRNIQGSVRNLSRQFASGATPFLQRAEQIKAVNERLEKISSRDARRFLQYQVALANENTPVNEKLELSSYIDVGDNWIDYADFAKTRKELLGTRGTTNITYDAQGRPVVNEMQLPNGIRAVMETRGRTADQTKNYLISEALSDSQMRAQLELEAKALGTSGNPVFAQMMDENGNFDPTKKVFVKFDKDGNIDETGQPLTGIEVMALSKFGGMGEAMADYSAQVKYESALNGNADNIGASNFVPAKVSAQMQNFETSTWYASSQEKLTNLNNQVQADINNISSQLGIKVIADENGIQVEHNGRLVDIEAYRATPEGKQNDSMLVNLINEYEAGRSEVVRIQREIQTYEDRIANALLKNDQTALFADNVEFDKETGEFSLTNIENIIEQNQEKLKVGFFDRVPEKVFLDKEDIRDRKEGEVFKSRIILNEQIADGRTFIKKNGKFYDITDNDFVKQVYSVIDNENKAFKSEMEARQEAVGYQFNITDSYDKGWMQTFENNFVSMAGSLTLGNGKLAKTDEAYGLKIQSVAFIDGRATILGTAIDADGNPVENGANSRFTGQQAQAILQNRFGAGYDFNLRVSQIQSIIGNSVGPGSSVEAPITKRELDNLFGENNAFSDKNISIEKRRNRTGNSESTKYYLKLDGRTIQNFNNVSELTAYLLQNARPSN
jgi:hypothetical protein